MTEVDLNHIYKKYDGNDRYSVNDFDLHIKDKEFIVFVGPSGCGKSTTLRMIAGLEDISKGTLEIDHKVMNDVAPKNRDIAMVFQNYALYPHMSVYDNMAFGLKLRKYSKEDIDKRVQRAAKILGLTDYLKRKPSALSGGQRQRMSIARALLKDSQILILDDALSAVDAKTETEILTSLRNERKDKTKMIAAHRLTSVMDADLILVLKDGQIIERGNHQDLLKENGWYAEIWRRQEMQEKVGEDVDE